MADFKVRKMAKEIADGGLKPHQIMTQKDFEIWCNVAPKYTLRDIHDKFPSYDEYREQNMSELYKEVKKRLRMK